MPTPKQRRLMMGGGSIPPWYLAGGITLAQVVAAYYPKTAPTLAASYKNLAHPGINDCTAPVAAPTLVSGWVFNGVNQFLNTGYLVTPITTMIVKFVNCTGTGYIIGSYDGGNQCFSIAPIRGAPGIRYVWDGDANNVGINLVAGNVAIVGSYGGARYGGFRNGTNELDIADAWAGVVALTTYIGARNAGGGVADNPCAATVEAVAIYSVALTAAQVAEVVMNMSGGRVIFDGDSRINSTKNTATEAISLSGKGYSYENYAVAGQTVVQMIADAATEIDPRVKHGKKNILVAWSGLNDNAIGDDAPTIYGYLVAYCQGRRAAGYKVIICTEIDAQPAWAPNWHAVVWPALNILINAGWTTFADGRADLGGNANLQVATNLTYFNADKAHLTTAGYSVAAAIIGTQIALL